MRSSKASARLELTAVTAFAPHLFPRQAEELRERVRGVVLQSCPELRELAEAGACELHVQLTADRRAADPFTVRGA